VVRHAVAFAFVALGFSRDPGCGGVGDSSGGANAPCTRTKDCSDGLTCVEGVCTGPDAALPVDAGPVDAGPDDPEDGDASDDGG
jgi:hypothetical protein